MNDNNIINYSIEGKGKTIVFIHGLSDTLHYWDTLANILNDNYRILRFDLRGHGKSQLGKDDITIETYADDLNNILDKLDINEVNLVGFSIGGSIALDFTLKYPGKVSSLVMMSSFSKCNDIQREIFYKLKYALKNSFIEFFDLILPIIYCPDFISRYHDEFEVIKKYASEITDCSGFIKVIDAGLPFDENERLNEVNVPSLILAGRYDEICTLSTQRILEENLSNSKLVIFDNVKHNLLVEDNVEKISNILRNFIR